MHSQDVSHRFSNLTCGVVLALTAMSPNAQRLFADDGPLLVPPAPATKGVTPTTLPAKANAVDPPELPVLDLQQLPNFPLQLPETSAQASTPVNSTSEAAVDDDGYSVIKSRKRRTVRSKPAAVPKALLPNPFGDNLPPQPLTPIPIEPVREPQQFPTLVPSPGLVPATPRLSGPSMRVPNDPLPGPQPDIVPSPFPTTDEADIVDEVDSNAMTTLQVGRMIDRIVLQSVPASYQNNDQWGKTQEVTTGVKLGFEGLLLKANRVRRKVNHGDWRKFDFSRSSQKGQPYVVAVRKLKMLSESQFEFTADYKIPYTANAHMQSFSRGISLRGMSVKSKANAQLTINCTVDFQTTAGRDASARQVILTPTVQSSSLTVVDFETDEGNGFDRSSRRDIGYQTKRLMKKRLVSHNKNLTNSLNKQLTEPIRVPLNELLATKWGKMLAGSTQLTQASAEERPRR